MPQIAPNDVIAEQAAELVHLKRALTQQEGTVQSLANANAGLSARIKKLQERFQLPKDDPDYINFEQPAATPETNLKTAVKTAVERKAAARKAR